MIQQLHIDIKTEDGISKELYDKLCNLIKSEGAEVMDDGQAPYTEDLTDVYMEMS